MYGKKNFIVEGEEENSILALFLRKVHKTVQTPHEKRLKWVIEKCSSI